jgi:hypothetical protein
MPRRAAGCEAKIGSDKDIPHVSAPMNITDLLSLALL